MAPKNWEADYKTVYITRPNIAYRDHWGAHPQRNGVEFLPLPVSDILLTFSGGEECHSDDDCVMALQALQRRDVDERGMPDIQYNYYIGSNGIVYEGRGWHVRSTQDPKFSHLDGISIDFALIGDFSEKDPTEVMTQAASDFLKYLLENGYVKEEFEITPMGMSRSPVGVEEDTKAKTVVGEEGTKGGEHKVVRYAIVRDPNDMSDEQPGLPGAHPGESEGKYLPPL